MATKKSRTSTADMDAALHTGAGAVKNGFGKALKGYDQLITFSKDNAEAVVKSANATGKGLETINSEVLAYTRKSVEDGMAAAKAVLSSRTVEEAFQLQSEFGKAVFETYVDQLAKFGDMALATARRAAEPLQARASAMTDFVRAA